MTLQPKPDSKKYIDLITEIQKGQIKIPKFQRSFVWSLDKTAKLLDSILKGYPIGTFILWETNERLNDIKNIGNLELPEIPEGSKVQYVLDGQQRITSLYAAYCGAKIQKEGEKKITDYCEIFVDLEKNIHDDEQIVTDEKPDGKHITLHQILNDGKYYDEIEDNYEKEDRKKIRKYGQAFNTYDFSIVVLRREDIDSAIEVFTRINTGGQTLTLFEIMSAKTYDEKENFDMAKKFQTLLEELEDCKYNTISSSVVLQSLSLILSSKKECKRNVILQLDKNAIISSWDDVVRSLKASIDYFRTVYRIPVSSILPYDSLLVPFTYFFYHNKEKPTGERAKYLEEFFWRISLSYRYSSASESKLAQDIKRIDQILDGERPNYDDIKLNLNSPQDLIDTNFSTGNSFSKAILCLMAYQEPKDFLDNGKVILDNSQLTKSNSKNFHHFFPKAYLKNQKTYNENSLVNITLVSANLNKRKIKAKAPSLYIKDFLDENEKLPRSLQSHFITDIDQFGIRSNDYEVFLQQRAKVIYNELQKRISLTHEQENPETEKIKELILEGEGHKLELKSTLRYDMRENKLNKKLEYVIAKTINAFLNTDGGILIIGVDDEGNIIGLEGDLSTLSKKDIDGFELHLRQVIKKYLGEYYEKYIQVSFPIVDNQHICIIKIQKSGKPVFLKHEGQEHFFVRNGNASIPKTRQEQSEYEKLHWG